ncbi:tetraacyldisaccharide 4'-kinase [Dokdonia sp.]|uniref:tetraacyldisaccharide 4'-kinase n=1 Tax=Dokdonia sp. TaxID=2024995 RepID=UPI003266DEF6
MKHLRKILFPFAGLYYIITLLRNKAYDWNINTHKEYEIPIICVGNLNTGGTGKSPMTEYLVRLVKGRCKTATLSRGYGRKTKGYLNVTADSLAEEVGDEPLQFARKFDDIKVAVCEDRQRGISTLLKSEFSPELIILDDAYQHRKVKAGFQIVLTAYGDLYVDDYILPVGNLREARKGIARAQVIVVTKCPDGFSKIERETIIERINPLPHQAVYFTTITYGDVLINDDTALSFPELKNKEITLVTGIANPKPLVSYLKNNGLEFDHKVYGDHHNFALSEIKTLESCGLIITTEKDYVRLRPLLSNNTLFYLPIEAKFIDKEEVFNKQLLEFINDF